MWEQKSSQSLRSSLAWPMGSFPVPRHIWFEFHESGIMFNDGGKATHGKYKSVSDG
jgi:hypothetical protein